MNEVIETILAIEHYCKKIKTIIPHKIDFNETEFPDTEGIVEFVPYGVVGIISPWNYPLILPMWSIIPAILAGNTIVFKPSEHTTLTGQKIFETLNQVLPDGIFNIVYGGPESGKIVVKSDIDRLFFTGSLETGKDIMKNIGIKPISLELGGKDAAIVCEDADMELTVNGVVWGALNNSGQVCVSTEIVYVSENKAKEFIEKVLEEVRMLKTGKDLPPLISTEKIETVEEQIKDAIEKGAELIYGGKRIPGDGFFFEPTIITGIKENMLIFQKETFGPVIAIMIVKNENEAIDLANKSEYGLGTTVWTKNVDNGKKIARMINVGMAWINDVNLPFAGGDYWGGTKKSGMRCSQDKIMQCMTAKNIISYSGDTKREWWYPY